MNKFDELYPAEDLESITLGDVVFECRRPGRLNKRFMRAVSDASGQYDGEGQYTAHDLGLGEMLDVNIDAFAKTCIVRVTGWPEYTLEALLARPEALEELYVQVVERTRAKEAQAEAAAKKSATTSNAPPDGPESGEDGKSSIDTLSRAAS